MTDNEKIRSIVEYAYAALDQNVAEQTIDMSVDFIRKSMSKDMTIENVQDIISAALDTTENRRLNPKWFGDVIRNTRAGTNRGQDAVETRYPAPVSNGSEDDDMKCSFLAMVGCALCWDGCHGFTGSNAAMHAWLVRHHIIREESGELQLWKREAEHYLSTQTKRAVTVRDFVQGENPQSFDDDIITDKAYMLWRNHRIDEIVKKIHDPKDTLSVDGFCTAVNRVTPETKPAFIVLDDTVYKFHIQ